MFDVGGTSLRAGLYDPAADALVAVARRRTASHWSDPESEPARLIDRLLDDLQALERDMDAPAPDAVAMGFPGPLDPEGRALALPTVLGPSSTGPVAIGELMAERWPRSSVVVVNDVTAAGFALLERPTEDLCVATVSSGVGAKVFVEGKPVVGRGGRGGEIGHLVVDRRADANPCECGGRGHLGAVASGRGVVISARRRAREEPRAFLASTLDATDAESIDAPSIVAAFRAGDPWMRRLVAEAADPLGAALAGIHCAVGSERIVLVGGFANALGEDYRRLVARAAAESCWDLGLDWDRALELRDMDGRAGLVGAGRYARSLVREGAA